MSSQPTELGYRPRHGGSHQKHGLSDAQNALYWREWNAAKVALIATGQLPAIGAATHNAARHQIHRDALDGRDVSHADFSNEDFDKVLAAFRAISAPTDLDAQLRAQGQPLLRANYQARALAARLTGAGHGSAAVTSYLDGVVRQMRLDGRLAGDAPAAFGHLNDVDEVKKVVVALELQTRRNAKRATRPRQEELFAF
ncbi:MAG: hypothetical protein JO295_03660 [Verrucomicrobia bacterium]|nr:hypothetical protein [Verrucomicrobiota bacterium]